MMRHRVILSRLALSPIALILIHVGCMTSGPRIVERQQSYVASEYAPYEGHGTAELSGQAYTKAREGDVIYGADDSVYLFPATRYTDEWWQRTLLEGKYLSDPDPRSLAFMRTTVADEQGRFRFRSLPAGEYYVVCIITWKRGLVGSTPHWERSATDPALQVANLGKRVHLSPNQAVDVTLESLSKHRALVDPPPMRSEDR